MRDITEINKLASMLREFANDSELNERERAACFTAYIIINRIARKLEQQTRREVRNVGRQVGPKIFKLLSTQEVH